MFCTLIIYLNNTNNFYFDPMLSFVTLIMLSILCLGHFKEMNEVMEKMSEEVNPKYVNTIMRSLNLIIFYYSCIMYYLPRANIFGYAVLSKQSYILNVICILVVLVKVLLEKNSNAFNYLFVVVYAIIIWDFKYFEYVIVLIIFFIYLAMNYIKINYSYILILTTIFFGFCLISLVYMSNSININGIMNGVIYIFLLYCVLLEKRGRKRNE